jgi:hypothetical protein
MAETHAIKGGQHRGREVEFAQVHEGWVAFGLAAEALAVDCGLDVVGLAERLQRADAEVSAAAATMGRKGGKVRSERKTAAVRQNAQRGGRPRCLGTILLDTADGKTRGRILWQKSSGQIRVARPGQTWDTAEDAAMAPEATIEEAGFAVMAAWRLPYWDLKMRGTE